MLRSIGKRVLQTVIVLFCVSLMIFVLLRIIPGDAITTMMGEHANADTIARLTKEMNLDKPFYVQFITYLKDICTGNFGTSYTLNKPVTELLAAAFPNTVKLAVMAAVIAWVIGYGLWNYCRSKKRRDPGPFVHGIFPARCFRTCLHGSDGTAVFYCL